jgi:multidrug resistance efflux pump
MTTNLRVLICATTLMGGAAAWRVRSLAPVEAMSAAGAPGEVRVSSEIDGLLQAIPPEEGHAVQRGQVIAVLENAGYQARVEVATVAVAQSRKTLANLTRALQETPGNYLADQLLQAHAEVDRAEAQLADAQMMLEKTYVRSPVKGFVMRKELKKGDRVVAGYDSIVTLADNSQP